jgi:hypothetical protein
MNDGTMVKVFGEAELTAARNGERRAGRECCGCPVCPCGCNGISTAIGR